MHVCVCINYMYLNFIASSGDSVVSKSNQSKDQHTTGWKNCIHMYVAAWYYNYYIRMYV